MSEFKVKPKFNYSCYDCLKPLEQKQVIAGLGMLHIATTLYPDREVWVHCTSKSIEPECFVQIGDTELLRLLKLLNHDVDYVDGIIVCTQCVLDNYPELDHDTGFLDDDM